MAAPGRERNLYMDKKWRIAVASLDGKVINEHFGRAREFFIIDIARDGSYQLVERRAVVPLCSEGGHSVKALEAHINTLRDCDAVLVSRIGMGARRALELNRIPVFEHPGYIDSTMAKLAVYFAKTKHNVPEE